MASARARRRGAPAAGGQLALLRQAGSDGRLFGPDLGRLDLGYQRGQLALDLRKGLLAGRQDLLRGVSLALELGEGRHRLVVGGRQLFRLRLL